MNTVAETNTTQTPVLETEREYITPGVNILETPEAYVLEAEMPGVNKSTLNVSVENNVLTLVGRRPAAPQGSVLYRESTLADYRRVFQLDPTVDAAKITAKMEQGILSVTLPKAAQAQPRQISVN